MEVKLMMTRSLIAITAVAMLLSGCDRIDYAIHKLTRSVTSSAVDAESLVVNSEKVRFEVVTLQTGFYLPWAVASLPDNSLLITEKPGAMYHFNQSTGKLNSIKGLPKTKKWGQGGFMDVIPHPNYQQNGWLYFSYTGLMEGKLAATRVARGRLVDDKLEDVEILFTAEPAVKSGAHFGSALTFDDKGYLFITSGERGQRPLIQELSNHLGKVLRLNDDGSVPPDNPFVGTEGARAEIYSYGHRNPQGIAIEPSTRQVWAVEHGPRGGDEVNILKPGANYGWPVVSYGKEYSSGAQIGEGTSKPGIEEPTYYYVPSIATSGMSFYTADAFPEWKGNLFIGALSLTHINRLEITNGEVTHEERLLKDLGKRIRDIEQGADGFFYVLTDDGELLQLRPITNS